MCGNTVICQACGKQKWSVLARSLNFLLIVERKRERERERERERAKQVIVYYVHAKCGKFCMF